MNIKDNFLKGWTEAAGFRASVTFILIFFSTIFAYVFIKDNMLIIGGFVVASFVSFLVGCCWPKKGATYEVGDEED